MEHYPLHPPPHHRIQTRMIPSFQSKVQKQDDPEHTISLKMMTRLLVAGATFYPF